MSDKIKVGDIVDYHSAIGGAVTSRNHEVLKISISSAGYPIAGIANKRGYVALEALTLSPDYHKKTMTDCKETYSKPEKRDLNYYYNPVVRPIDLKRMGLTYDIGYNKAIEKCDLYHEQEMKKERERVDEVLSEANLSKVVDENIRCSCGLVHGRFRVAKAIRALLEEK